MELRGCCCEESRDGVEHPRWGEAYEDPRLRRGCVPGQRVCVRGEEWG